MKPSELSNTDLLTELFDYFDEWEKTTKRLHEKPNDYTRGKLAVMKVVKNQICHVSRWHDIPLSRKTPNTTK